MTPFAPYPEPPTSISARPNSAELAARLRGLAKSGLVAGRRIAGAGGRDRPADGWPAVLRRLSLRLENGEPLEKAIAAPDCRLPSCSAD